MRLRRVADGFVIGGVTLGILAAVGYAGNIVPELPPAVLKLVIYKLTFIGALGLVVFGAFLRRIATRQQPNGDHTPAPPHDVADPDTRPQLREGADLDARWLAEREPIPRPQRSQER